MKFLHIVSLVGMLWLTGCATTGGAPGVVSNAPDDTPTSSRPAHTPIIPKGPLQPIKAANASSLEVASLSAPADLWDRIRRGFAMPDLQHELVQDREQWYASRPDYMQRMTERSSKYLFHIVEELERRGMPTELALLPYIESAFNPQAVSSAKAAGMWQFMPATGSYFDLKQNAFRDDRRDVLARRIDEALDRGRLPDVDALRDEFLPTARSQRDVTIPPPDLHSYNSLIASGEVY